MILVLFTGSYPFDYAVEQNFLADELELLAENFERVILIPQVCKGTRLPVPASVEVVEDYAAFLASGSRIGRTARVLFSPWFYRELFTIPRVLLHPSALIRLLAFFGNAYRTSLWLESWMDKNNLDTRQSIFYTYWFDQAVAGIGLARQRHPTLRLVSRAHGYDIFEDRYSPPYWPGRQASFEAVDMVFSVSDAGAAYLKEHYPAYSSRVEVSRLGVRDPGYMTQPSADGTFRLASCSIIRPVKRIELLLDGFAFAALQRPDQKFEWCHLGVSEVEGVRQELQARADRTLPPNAHAFFPGYIDHQTLMDYYHSHPVDVFVNVSASEGIPVSSMEAISCGIPMIATDVGGNREIVNPENGLLLSPDPTPQEIADAIHRYLDAPDWAAAMRQGSYALWKTKYNADDNFKAFIRRLKSIREAGSSS